MKFHPIFKQVRNLWQGNPSAPKNNPGQNHFRAITVLSATAIAITIAASYGSSLAPAAPAPMVVNSAVSVSENADHYLVTLTLPGSQSPQVDIRMRGNKLQIASGHRTDGDRFEQSLLLPQADTLLGPSVTRAKDQLLISVPKATGVAQASSNAQRALPSTAIDPQDQDVTQQFARMQQQMAAMMKQAFQGFPQAGNMPNVMSGGFAGAMPGGVAVNIEDKPDAYVVHAQVPDKQMKDVRVSVDNDRVLNITTKNSSSTGGMGSAMTSTQTSDSSQMLTLPGPVNSKYMKVDQRDGELQITIPKA